MSVFFMPLAAYAADISDDTEPFVSETLDESTDNEPEETPDLSNISELDGLDLEGFDFAGLLALFNMFAMAAEEAERNNPNAFTPDGQASVTDWVIEYDGKEFYTFTTPAGNVFYLIIDHARENNNVYFLNAVTESDLIALAEKAGEPVGESAIPSAPRPTEKTETSGETEPPGDESEPPAKSGGSNGMVIFIVIGAVVLGGAGYYIKIVRPKKQAPLDDDDEYGEEPANDDRDYPYENDDDSDDPDGDVSDNTNETGSSDEDEYPDDEDIDYEEREYDERE